MGRAVALQVRQVHVVIALAEQRIENGREDAGLVRAEMVAGDEVERRARFGLMIVMPLRRV